MDIIGDASHGQPRWLGQAANLAFANALALTEFVTYSPDVTTGLAAWERACRPLTDHTERWTNRSLWPRGRGLARVGTGHPLAGAQGLRGYAGRGVELNRAQHTPVIGTERLAPRLAATAVQ